MELISTPTEVASSGLVPVSLFGGAPTPANSVPGRARTGPGAAGSPHEPPLLHLPEELGRSATEGGLLAVRQPCAPQNGPESNGRVQHVHVHEGLFPVLPLDRFQIIYADPPWDYRGQLQHAGPGSNDTGGAIRHYPTVTLSDLKELPISKIAADDCLLFLWATNPHLDQAIDLGKSWGFSWATVAFVWDKIRVNPGFYTLSQCELCLVFKRGKIPRPRGARNVRQLVSAKRGPHSVKPVEVRERIQKMFPGQNKIELFARRETEGWVAWGLGVHGARTSAV